MTTKAMISDWFDHGKRRGATHLIVVCDTFDHTDYPVLVYPHENIKERFSHYNGPNMQRVMEVYCLSEDKAEQLAEDRTFRL